jgi:hypothetical protein
LVVNAAFILTVVAGFVAALAVIYYSIRLPYQGKSENLQGWFRLNPLNAVFTPAKLSPKGIVLRRRLLISVGCFVVCLALGVILGLIAKALAAG